MYRCWQVSGTFSKVIMTKSLRWKAFCFLLNLISKHCVPLGWVCTHLLVSGIIEPLSSVCLFMWRVHVLCPPTYSQTHILFHVSSVRHYQCGRGPMREKVRGGIGSMSNGLRGGMWENRATVRVLNSRLIVPSSPSVYHYPAFPGNISMSRAQYQSVVSCVNSPSWCLKCFEWRERNDDVVPRAQ